MDNYYRPASYRLLPPVIKWIMIVNVVMFLITLLAEKSGREQEMYNFFALHYFLSDLFQPHQLATYAFMHGGYTHILFNMFALWMFGTMLENVWGGKRFLIYYMFTAIGAGLTHWAFQYFELSQFMHHINAFIAHPDPYDLRLLYEQNAQGIISDESSLRITNLIDAYSSQPQNPEYINQAIEFARSLVAFKTSTPVLGASGAVFGVLLAFGMMFPDMLIYVYFLFPIKAKYFVIGYGVLEFFSAVQNNPADNVAHFAHLGGMLFGIILILLWKKRAQRFH